jgi:hypothetical protein
MKRRNKGISDKGFPLPDWFLEDHPEVEGESLEKVSPKEMDSYLHNPGSTKRLDGSRWFLPLVGLLCIVFGALILTVLLLKKPWVKTNQAVGERVRRPIPSIARKEERKIPRVVERKRIEPKPLGGGTAGEEKRAASESSMTIGENQIDGTRMFFPGKKEGAKQEKKGETTEVKGKGVEIKEEEEGKPRVALIEEPKGPAIAKEKLTEEGYTINIASFRDRREGQCSSQGNLVSGCSGEIFLTGRGSILWPRAEREGNQFFLY